MDDPSNIDRMVERDRRDRSAMRTLVFLHPDDVPWFSDVHGKSDVPTHSYDVASNGAAVARRFNVKFVPTAITLLGGDVVGQQVGSATKADVEMYYRQMAMRAAMRDARK